MKAYFRDDKFVYFDELGYDYALLECSLIKLDAMEQYEAHLKNQESEAKDWENTKWHLEKQFTQF
jgi:hypothetical protein